MDEKYATYQITSEKNGKTIKTTVRGEIPILNDQKYQEFANPIEINNLKNYNLSKRIVELIKLQVRKNIERLKGSDNIRDITETIRELK